MNRKSIKSIFINPIALTLVWLMMVFVACQKEVGIAPNTSPAANSGLANKEVAFNPGTYDQAAGDPLFTAYYEAAMQLKAPLLNKIMKERPMEKSDKLLASINAAIENNNLEQVASLMGYESLECYIATVANVKSAASKLIQKYPSLAPENPGAMEKASGIFFEKYQPSSASPFSREAMYAWDKCGSECVKPKVPNITCCNKAVRVAKNDIAICAGTALAAYGACAATGFGWPVCAAIVLAAETVCITAARLKCNTDRAYCCQ